MKSTAIAFQTSLSIGTKPSISSFSSEKYLSTVRKPSKHTISTRQVFQSSLKAEKSTSKTSVDWIQKNGGKVEEKLIDLSRIDDITKRGLYLSTEINKKILKNTELVNIPESLVLTPKKAKEIIEEWNPGCVEKLSIGNESFVALALLIEKEKGNNSIYSKLIDSLPQEEEMNLPIFWSDEELNMLKGSSVYENCIEIKEAIYNEYISLKEILPKMNNENFGFEMYKWSVGIIDSRSLSAGSSESLVLCELIHFLNAGTDDIKANTRLESSGGMFFSKKRYSLLVDKDMTQGEEMTISYGTNIKATDYLLERGILYEKGMKTMIEMKFSLTNFDRFYEDKCDILEMRQIEPSVTFELEESEQESKWEGPEDMDAFLRFSCITGGDAFLLESVFRDDVWDFMSLPVSEENERSMCDLVIGACDDHLDEYTYDFSKEDERNEMNDMQKRRKNCAKLLVEKEKKLLESVKLKYERIVNSLDALEYYAERRLKELDLLRPIDECEIVDSESGGRVSRAFDENYS